METVSITAERKAQLEEYARRHGQDATAALDEALGTYLEWERADLEQALGGVRRGYEDVKAGRTRPAAEFFEEVRKLYDFPR
jgi:predicted transcriptional regulator